MNQKLLVLFLCLAMLSLTLSSYQSGPYSTAGLNRTGANGGPANCSGSGCHAANNPNTVVEIRLMDTTGGIPKEVSTYIPGKTYRLDINSYNYSASSSKFGFQICAVKASDNATQSGILAVYAWGVLITSATPNIIEHNKLETGQGAGTSFQYPLGCFWTAPSSGKGSVKFMVTVNAVNNNGNASGDQPNNASLTIPEYLSISSLAENGNITIYPNPATSNITVHVGNSAGTYTINAFDLRGKMIASQITDINTNNQDAHINSEKWAGGLYMIQISKDGEQKVFPIVKQ